jgi:hypothetical protein
MSALAVVRPRGAAPGAPARGAARVTAAAPSVATGRLRLATALLTIGVAAGALFMAVGLNAAAAQAAVVARQLESDVRTAERRHAELLVAVTELEDPARIRARALELGMVPAPAARHLVLRRAVPADGAPDPAESAVSDPLKPVLTQER